MSNEQLNIAEILKDAPKGMEINLYSPLVGECKLKQLNQEKGLIRITAEDGCDYDFHKDGRYLKFLGDCLLFPGNGIGWEHWQEHIFEKGCFVKNVETEETFLYKGDNCIQDEKGNLISKLCMDDYRFANGCEISSFLNKVIDNGFRYNVSENDIEPYIIPNDRTIRFNVGKAAVSEFNLTQKQFDVVKAVIEVITKKR